MTAVRQPEHARVAAEICRAWRLEELVDDDPAVRRLFLDAVRRHDDGWIEWERKALDRGARRLLDFKRMPSTDHSDIWRRSVELGAQDHPYLGALIALHAHGLYTDSVKTGDEEDADEVVRLVDWLNDCIDDAVERLRKMDEPWRAFDRPALEADRVWLTVADGLTLMMLEGVPRNDRLRAGGADIELHWHAGERVTVTAPARIMARSVSVVFETIDGDDLSWTVEPPRTGHSSG